MDNQLISTKDALRILDNAVSQAPITRTDHNNIMQVMRALEARLTQADEMEAKLAELEEKLDGDKDKNT